MADQHLHPRRRPGAEQTGGLGFAGLWQTRSVREGDTALPAARGETVSTSGRLGGWIHRVRATVFAAKRAGSHGAFTRKDVLLLATHAAMARQARILSLPREEA